MSIKTRSESQRKADEEALRVAALTNLKRDCARELVPIFRLVRQGRWAEASVEVDVFLEQPVDKLLLNSDRRRIFNDAVKLRFDEPDSIHDGIALGRKLVEIQLEKEAAQRAARQRAEAKR